MRKQNLQDERVLAQRRRISSKAYGILMMVLLCSVLVRQRLLNAPFEQYAVGLMCFFGMSLYVIVRYLTLELDIYGEEKQAKAFPPINGIVTEVVVAAINGVLSYTQYAGQHRKDGIDYFIAILIVIFISSTILTYTILFSLKYLNAKRQAKVQKQLDGKGLGEQLFFFDSQV